jgi:hypothetical protein
VRRILEHDQLRIRQSRRRVLGCADRPGPDVSRGQHRHRMGHLAEPILDLDPTIVLHGEVPNARLLGSPQLRRPIAPS